MSDIVLPFPSVRLNAYRPIGELYDDISIAVNSYLKFYSRIERSIAPYNSKNAYGHLPYIPPTRQYLIDVIGQRNIPKNLDELTVNNMLTSTIRFCERHKGKRQLCLPHHSTHHSLQFSYGNFVIDEVTKEEFNSLGRSNSKINNVHKISLTGFKPLYVENFRPNKFKYLILRQRMSKTGVPSTTNWEILLFKNNFQYMIEWVDAEINTRYCGIV